jgi:hypothetical protein
MSEMVERVARALFDETYNPAHLSLDEAWALNRNDIQSYYRTSARVAMIAMREPTEAMMDAGMMSGSALLCDAEIRCHWQDMIDEALKP